MNTEGRARDGSRQAETLAARGEARQPGGEATRPESPAGAQEGVPAEVLDALRAAQPVLDAVYLALKSADGIPAWSSGTPVWSLINARSLVNAVLATHPTSAQEAPGAARRIAGAEPVTMPAYWQVQVIADGETLLSIGHDWVSGERPLEQADERTILGAAQHLLAFIGHGLPAGNFDPDDEAAPAPQEAPQAETPAAWQSRVNLGGRWTEWKECAPLADDEPRELVSDGRVAYQFRPLYATPQAPQESAGRHLLPVQLPDGRIVKMRKCDLIGTDQMAFCDFDALPPQRPQESAGVVPLTDEQRQTLFRVLREAVEIGWIPAAEYSELRAALAATRAEPAGWDVPHLPGTTGDSLEDGMAALARAEPEFTDTARAALLWVLWHHQGGSSKVGQPIRFALGMGAHDHLTEDQVAEAKRWGELQARAEPAGGRDERRDFEAWASARHLIGRTGYSPSGKLAWEVWQAARATPPAPAPEPARLPELGDVVVFAIDTSKINHLMLAGMKECLAAAKRARWTNVVTRRDGVERTWEADWLKHLQRVSLEALREAAEAEVRRLAAAAHPAPGGGL